MMRRLTKRQWLSLISCRSGTRLIRAGPMMRVAEILCRCEAASQPHWRLHGRVAYSGRQAEDSITDSIYCSLLGVSACLATRCALRQQGYATTSSTCCNMPRLGALLLPPPVDDIDHASGSPVDRRWHMELYGVHALRAVGLGP